MKKGYLLSNPQNGFPYKIRSMLKNDILAGNCNIVFLPCNYQQLEKNENYHAINTKWFTDCGIEFQSNILLNKNMPSKEIKHCIEHADILFLMGGLQLEQMKFCYEKDIVEFISNFNGIVIGICAGAINMASTVTSLYMSNMKNPLQTYYKGFSFVDFNILPHIKNRKNISVSNNNYIILPDETVIVVEKGKCNFIGKYEILSQKKAVIGCPKIYGDIDVENKKEFMLILINVVFINCSTQFGFLNKSQKAEFKQMFKYLMMELNMNFDMFLSLYSETKLNYKIYGNDNLEFLKDEYYSIKKSLMDAKNEILNNKYLNDDELNYLIYDRYGVTVDEAVRY